MSNLSSVPRVDIRAKYRDRLANRDAVVKALNEAGIQARHPYPFAGHERHAFKSLEYHPGTFSVAENWVRQCFSLPIYAEIPIGVIPATADIFNHSVYH
ncbi:DegT/DnrJ/EryC1/StrS family aminotransferase [candidate division KSB1 bacterium]|nr:DegT/DnrJ/EryC1/StrS family aminotransferase [candidate division KSB1 bacterium]